MEQRYIIEPIEFAFTNDLFKGLSEAISQKVIIINNFDDAYKYAFEQNLPSGYKVWNDTIEQCRKSLRKNKKFQEAYDFVTGNLESLQVKNASSLIEFRKKKIKKTNTAHDNFIFSEAKEDAFFVLSTVAINRYLDNFIKDAFLEDIYALYKAGAWPCGMKGSVILVFDPASLS
ncbi:hypothetical protein HZI30_06055 [Serratia fonticola]|uniref:hypothetical protein n=1 Tax=Serratia fonticola TaxID=47917 RepID=UPI0015C5BFFC|nr:hypothetical protein [Serratia fonticola]NXZ86499.1 hypothetical protein [Serratia fonticola]